jgi:hypothetical protein
MFGKMMVAPPRLDRSLSDDETPRLSCTSFDHILVDVVTFRPFECAQIATPWVTGFATHKHHFGTALRADSISGNSVEFRRGFAMRALFFYDPLSGRVLVQAY